MQKLFAWMTVLPALAFLTGCAAPLRPAATASDASLGWGGVDTSGAARQWVHKEFPGKQSTEYEYAFDGQLPSVRARSDGSASMLKTPLQVAPEAIGHLHFSWKVPALIADADMMRRDADDAPSRVVLAFEGDRSRFSTKDAILSELARTLTGEEMPYATLMYVWCNKRPVGSVIPHPRSDRIKSIVVESGPARLGQWIAYDRDVRADFEKAFGEAPGMLAGVGVMTDSDNTASRALAWYGPVRLAPVSGASQSIASHP